ncbi:MAG: MmgE/PrpD family protein [Alphaproteobacteria bacterium]|nr:MmgE/PrpD family protein [Alphaproteobacteria bacterium]
MSDNHDQLGRRSFLNRIAAAASAVPLAPALLAIPAASVPAREAEAAQAAAAHKGASGYTPKLADYVTKFRYDDAPAEVRQRMKDCITDTVAVILYGGQLPWSQMIIAHAKKTGPGGKSRILGTGATGVQAPSAALAHGAMTHAFELDNLTDPNSGSHPGATMFSAGLAVAQERGLGGRALLEGMIAGGEAMIRIGLAAKGTLEPRGFHAPGTTGPFGGAITVGKLMGFDNVKMTNALGIAGSLCGGLLEFAHSGTGAMVKRLHLGRAAESGVLAASLAADGFTGPNTVLEGEAGYLNAFGEDPDYEVLTGGLGRDYVNMSIMLKRFACHITAHRPVEAMLDLRNEHKFAPADIETIAITGNQRMVGPNNIPAPPDRLLAQYSVPFSVALSLYRNPIDPDSFDENVHRDAQILAMAKRVKMIIKPGQTREDMTTTLAVTLKNGRTLTKLTTEFQGTPARPLNRAGLREKFMLMSKRFQRAEMERLFDRLQNIETERNLDWISV